MISRKAVDSFVRKYHYSQSTRGLHVSYCFGLFKEGNFGLPKMIGAMIYGIPAMYGVAEKYYPDNPSVVIELNRLCCIDDTPKNTESYFIGKTLKWLKNNTNFKVILSYADSARNHNGTIYKASNFIYLGMTSPDRVLIVDGEKYHSRMLTKKSPKFENFRKRIKNKDESIIIKKLPSKHIFVYSFDRKIKKKFKNNILEK